MQRVDTHIATLAELITDNPKQLSRVVTLRSLAKQKMDELAHTIVLYGEGKKDEEARTKASWKERLAGSASLK